MLDVGISLGSLQYVAHLTFAMLGLPIGGFVTVQCYQYVWEHYRLFDVPHINQVYMFYRCGIEGGEYGVGPESLETELLRPDQIPWDNIAFPVVRELLTEFIEDSRVGQFPVRHSVISLGRTR